MTGAITAGGRFFTLSTAWAGISACIGTLASAEKLLHDAALEEAATEVARLRAALEKVAADLEKRLN